MIIPNNKVNLTSMPRTPAEAFIQLQVLSFLLKTHKKELDEIVKSFDEIFKQKFENTLDKESGLYNIDDEVIQKEINNIKNKLSSLLSFFSNPPDNYKTNTNLLETLSNFRIFEGINSSTCKLIFLLEKIDEIQTKIFQTEDDKHLGLSLKKIKSPVPEVLEDQKELSLQKKITPRIIYKEERLAAQDFYKSFKNDILALKTFIEKDCLIKTKNDLISKNNLFEKLDNLLNEVNLLKKTDAICFAEVQHDSWKQFKNCEPLCENFSSRNTRWLVKFFKHLDKQIDQLNPISAYATSSNCYRVAGQVQGWSPALFGSELDIIPQNVVSPKQTVSIGA